ncbi:aldehyde dehydrogenase [Rhodococcus erythropolis]|uniref:aldehyde dehydrogenase n=1 Tax=Rhodococcus erythropolis TaxID=1833 RepID=UPI0037948728
MIAYEYDKFLIGGKWVLPEGDGVIDVVSPASGAVVARVPEAVPADIDKAVAAARKAWDDRVWRDQSPEDRAKIIVKLAELLDSNTEDLAQRVTAEMGSPITMSRGSQKAGIGLVFSFVDAVREIAFEERRQTKRGPVSIRRQPVGVVAAISPWNGPLYLSLVKVIPALLAGCSVIAKPAIETPLTGYRLGELMLEAGIPEGVLSIIPAGREVGQHLVAHPGIDRVSFTGSTAAGRLIAATCGQQLKGCSLELGGKSAAIVLDDADIDVVVPAMVAGAFYNTGQACNALTRMVVHSNRHNEVVSALVDAVRKMKVGDPSDPDTVIGPLVSRTQLDRVNRYIDIGKSEGAVLACGGGRPSGLESGYYVEPTVFTDVHNDMTIAQEEIFGPVLSVIRYDGDDDEAIAIANASIYGLHGAVFTRDTERAQRIASRVEAGTFSINGYVTNPDAPYGGVKASGLGRENGAEGLAEFLDYHVINDPRAAS